MIEGLFISVTPTYLMAFNSPSATIILSNNKTEWTPIPSQANKILSPKNLGHRKQVNLLLKSWSARGNRLEPYRENTRL